MPTMMKGPLMRWPWTRLEPRLLAVVAGAASAAWVFIEVAESVVEGETGALDHALLRGLRDPSDPAVPLGPPWLAETARDITALGSPVVLCLIVALAAVFFALAGQRRTGFFVAAACGGGALTASLLKAFFARPRPELFPHGVPVFTTSFPSGHAMLAAVVYLTLGALIARGVPGRRLQGYILGVAVLLAGLVGVSRVYLGVHWPSDVLAGWAAGAAWALACWGAAQVVALGPDRRP